MEQYKLNICNKKNWEQYIEGDYKTLFEKIKVCKEKIDPFFESVDDKEDGNWEMIRRKYNKAEYIFHTNQTEKDQNISKIIPASRAFFKLWEICNKFELCQELNTISCLSLCEAPGSFLENFIYFRQQMLDEYYGISLLNSNSSIPNWNKLLEKKKKNVHYSTLKKLEYGDLISLESFENISQKIKLNSFDYLTCDGGFDINKNFNDQEIIVYNLLVFEIVWSLLFLKKGGKLIIKIFDFYSKITQHLLLWVFNYFSDWYIYKPLFSRETNSEKYIILKNKIDMTQEEIDELKEFFFKTFLNKINENSEELYWIEKKELNQKDQNNLEKLHTYILEYSEKQQKSIQNYIDILINPPDEHNFKIFMQNAIKEGIEWCNKYKLPINNQSRHLKYFFIENEFKKSCSNESSSSDEEKYKFKKYSFILKKREKLLKN